MAKINTAERVSAEASDNFVFQRSLLAYHTASARIAGDVLDLFAGTGQLGIEALSRGAAECLFVDSARDSVRLVQENLRRCGLAARVLQCDALGILKSGEKFDLIFLDPPYGSGLEAKAIETVKEFDILSRGGIMVVETRPETALPVLPPEYGTTKTYRYGKIKLTVITRGNN